MPTAGIAIAMGVQEGDCGWQSVVVLDDVRQVRICLSSFVLIRMQGVASVIDCINGMLPSEKVQLFGPIRI